MRGCVVSTGFVRVRGAWEYDDLCDLLDAQVRDGLVVEVDAQTAPLVAVWARGRHRGVDVRVVPLTTTKAAPRSTPKGSGGRQ